MATKKSSPEISIIRCSPPGHTTAQLINSTFLPDPYHIPPRPEPQSGQEAQLFHDALSVRVPVFVWEQKCDYAIEVDRDDERSYHFNCLMKTGEESTTSSTSATAGSGPGAGSGAGAGLGVGVGVGAAALLGPASLDPAKDTVATIRLVPGPHDVHPLPGSQDSIGGSATGPHDAANRKPGHRDVSTAMHDGHELFAKIGRLATLKQARRKGLASRLIDHALEWARENPELLDRKKGVEGDGPEDTGTVWKGLVLLHAQADVAPLYAKCGFVEDVELGRWYEGGIEHLAMWQRIKVNRK